MPTYCIISNTYAELNGQEVEIVPGKFLTVYSAVPGTVPDDAAYVLYDPATGAISLELMIGSTPVSVPLGTTSTGL